MFVRANDFDKLCAFILKAKKNQFSNKDWAEFGDIYKRTLLKYQHDKKESAKRMKEGRVKDKQYGRGRSAYAFKKSPRPSTCDKMASQRRDPSALSPILRRMGDTLGAYRLQIRVDYRI